MGRRAGGQARIPVPGRVDRTVPALQPAENERDEFAAPFRAIRRGAEGDEPPGIVPFETDPAVMDLDPHPAGFPEAGSPAHDIAPETVWRPTRAVVKPADWTLIGMVISCFTSIQGGQPGALNNNPGSPLRSVRGDNRS